MRSHILARLRAPDVAFVLPRAPGNVWYAARAVDPLTAETRAALAAAVGHLAADVAMARAAYPGLPLVLAGFSQGACLSLEYAFAGCPPPEALVALTGCRVGVAEDDRPRALPAGLPVYLTGSDADPWIPVAAFAGAALELGQARARLRADLFPGRPHEATDAEVAMLQTVLADLAATGTTTMAAPR
jgi:phospholipase/carboxylesterase